MAGPAQTLKRKRATMATCCVLAMLTLIVSVDMEGWSTTKDALAEAFYWAQWSVVFAKYSMANTWHLQTGYTLWYNRADMVHRELQLKGTCQGQDGKFSTLLQDNTTSSNVYYAKYTLKKPELPRCR